MRNLVSLTGFVLLSLLAPIAIAADEKPKKITIATWNLEWFFDNDQGDNRSDLSKEQSAPSKDEWNWKLDAAARVIGRMKPTIMALQEIENRHVTRELTKRLKEKHGLNYRVAYIEGWDSFTEQDVAVIYQSGLVSYSFRQQSKEMYDSRNYFNVNKHLFANFEWGDGDDRQSLTLLTTHLRARAEKADLRQRQIRLMRAWLNEQIDEQENVVILGDFNTEETAGNVHPDSDFGILLNNETTQKQDDLIDLHLKLPKPVRSTHLGGRQYDRIVVTPAMIENTRKSKDLVFSGIKSYRDLVVVGKPDQNHFNSFYDIPRGERDISDHYPVMAEFLFK